MTGVLGANHVLLLRAFIIWTEEWYTVYCKCYNLFTGRMKVHYSETFILLSQLMESTQQSPKQSALIRAFKICRYTPHMWCVFVVQTHSGAFPLWVWFIWISVNAAGLTSVCSKHALRPAFYWALLRFHQSVNPKRTADVWTSLSLNCQWIIFCFGAN